MPESARRRAYASSPVAGSALRAARGGDMGGGAKEKDAGGANWSDETGVRKGDEKLYGRLWCIRTV